MVASSSPDETIAIYYDSYRNLVAQGVLPRKERWAKRDPQPFPEGFAPDPCDTEEDDPIPYRAPRHCAPDPAA